MNYAKLYNPAETPQQEQARADQVMNNERGFVFVLDAWKRLERFLIIGSATNSYYQTAQKLTRENAKVVEHCWLEDPVRTAAAIMDVSLAGRAPKNDPAIFALALGAVSENVDARKASYAAVRAVCRTGTHLFQYVQMARALGKGSGRGFIDAIASWYATRPVDDVAYQVVKYRQREGLTHDNLLAISHSKSGNDAARQALYDWITQRFGWVDKTDQLPAIVLDHIRAMALMTPDRDAAAVVDLIRGNPKLPWEALPTWANANSDVQKALIPGMGLTALIRNLGNLTRIGAIKPMSDEEATIVRRLGDEKELRKSRVHPMAILTALTVYAGGISQRGGTGRAPTADVNRWDPNQKICGALDRAFYAAFQNVVPSGKRHVIGVDVSGSMSSPVSGSTTLSCAMAAAAMAMVIDRTEPKTFVGRFNNSFEPVPITSCRSLHDVLRYTQDINGGGTDCSLPMLYALEKGIEADVFVSVTDNETHHGRMHPFQALKQYRKKTGIPAKLVVIGLTATGFSIAPPDDAGCLDVAGFDSAMMAVIADFARA